MPRMPYIQANRHGVYRVRREIPEEARFAFDGKKWFTYNLETRDPREADKRSRPVLAEFDKKLERALRHEVFWDSHSMEHYAGLFFSHVGSNAFYDSPHRFENRGEFLQSLGEFCRSNNLDIAGQDFEDFITFLEGENPDLYPVESEASPARQPTVSGFQGFQPTQRIRISELRDALLEREHYRERTSRDVKYAYNVLIRLHGDIPLTQVTQELIREARDILLRYPVSGRDSEIKRQPMREIAKRDWERTVSPKTVKKLFGFLNKGFRLALSEGWTGINPVKDIIVPNRTATSRSVEKREFRPQELTTLFDSPLFTGCRSNARRSSPGNFQVRDHGYWLPWLALFTGCRLGELSQLETTNVREDFGVWYLEIIRVSDQDNGDKNTKTKGSVRSFPIHHKLIELGFLEYVASLEPGLLFPLDREGPEHLAHEFSKWFGNYLGRIGLDDPAISLHSFRHNFKSGCRMANIPMEIHDELTGHAPLSVGGRYGEGKRKMEYLKESIDRIHYEGID